MTPRALLRLARRFLLRLAVRRLLCCGRPSPPSREASLNASLRNLGVGAVDALYLHNAAEKQLAPLGRARFLARLRVAFAHLEV